jgi:hypothetical protein
VSDDWTILVPTDPAYMPTQDQRDRAWHTVATFVPESSPRWELSEDPVFVDAGGNWSGVRCPDCGAALDDEWWSTAVGVAYEGRFRDLHIEMPCCGVTGSLNDLTDPWPVAFGRARLVLDGSPEVPPGVTRDAEQVLGCGLRTVRRHL